MTVELLRRVQSDIGFGEGKHDSATEPDLPLSSNDRQPPFHLIGLDGVGPVALQTEQNRRHGAVAAARGSQRPVQVDADIDDLVDHIARAELVDEHAGGSHRPDGM